MDDEIMNITSATFSLVEEGEQSTSIKATIDGVEMSVPMDLNNRHYAEIMRQVDAGTLIIQEP